MQYEGTVYDAFKLMAGVTFAARKGMDARLRAVGITFPQFGAMMTLEEHSLITQTELAAHLSTDTTTAMVICDSLQKKGLIRRVPDSRDRRVNRLELTSDGRIALDKASPLIIDYYQPVVAALGENEWATLKALLETVSGCLGRG